MPNLENSTDYILMLDKGVSSNDIRGSLSENLLDLKAAELVMGGVYHLLYARITLRSVTTSL